MCLQQQRATELEAQKVKPVPSPSSRGGAMISRRETSSSVSDEEATSTTFSSAASSDNVHPGYVPIGIAQGRKVTNSHTEDEKQGQEETSKHSIDENDSEGRESARSRSDSYSSGREVGSSFSRGGSKTPNAKKTRSRRRSTNRPKSRHRRRMVRKKKRQKDETRDIDKDGQMRSSDSNVAIGSDSISDEESECKIQLMRNMEVVEKSPKGRFVRFNQLLGEGEFKKVYRGWDSRRGIEVAWNSVKITPDIVGSKRTLQEMKILQKLDHPNIIHFFASWLNKEQMTLCFVTEIITSGTLKEFISTRPITLRILKRWCRSILFAIDYLHTHDPPIMHRDLKCDNVFINGATGDIRIGDLGLASWERGGAAQSCLGTPEYMAPELYEDTYDEQVDIYAFGMCVLEMVTKQRPYQECKSAPQIYRKVVSGILPQSFNKLKDCDVKKFIYWCIGKPERGGKRPSAKDLIESDFLAVKPEGTNHVSIDVSEFLVSSNGTLLRDETKMPSGEESSFDCTEVRSERESDKDATSEGGKKANNSVTKTQTSTEAVKSGYRCKILTKTCQSVDMLLEIETPSNTKINFNFQKHDTPAGVAKEMVKEGVLPESDCIIVQNCIEKTVKKPKNAEEKVQS